MSKHQENPASGSRIREVGTDVGIVYKLLDSPMVPRTHLGGGAPALAHSAPTGGSLHPGEELRRSCLQNLSAPSARSGAWWVVSEDAVSPEHQSVPFNPLTHQGGSNAFTSDMVHELTGSVSPSLMGIKTEAAALSRLHFLFLYAVLGNRDQTVMLLYNTSYININNARVQWSIYI